MDGKRVLLLEDNLDVAESMTAAFEMRGAAVDHVTTVAAALESYDVDKYDVIVADYDVPDGTGLDLIAQVRGSDGAEVVLFSGLDRSREIRAAGMDGEVNQVSKGDPDALLDLLEARDGVS